MSAQLDIFESSDVSNLTEKVNQYKESADKVRRGVFARIDAHKNEIGKMFIDLYEQTQEMKKEIENLKQLVNTK